jgi:truncated hemoglobin YjbI
VADSSTPTLYEWAGGQEALERLTTRFYENVAADALLAPLFARMDAHHPRFVAQFIAEVFGGPTTYSGERGGHAHMIRAHPNPGTRSSRTHLCPAGDGAWSAVLIIPAEFGRSDRKR